MKAHLIPALVPTFAAALVAGLTTAGLTATAACDELAIPSIDLERCVVEGGVAEIDAGEVVRLDTLSSDTVHWIAGHRTTHGGPFRPLPGIAIGDRVIYRGDTYQVIEYEQVHRFRTRPISDWFSSDLGSVVLQTSSHDDYVHVWRTELVAAPAARLAGRALRAADPTPTLFGRH